VFASRFPEHSLQYVLYYTVDVHVLAMCCAVSCDVGAVSLLNVWSLYTLPPGISPNEVNNDINAYLPVKFIDKLHVCFPKNAEF
jgi:hypothetical protein